MRRIMFFTLAAVACSALTFSAAAQSAGDDVDPNDLRVFWDHGLRMETSDGDFQFRIGGRLQNDAVFWGNDAAVSESVGGPLQDGTEVRRARLFVQGTMYKRIEFKAQYDFAGGEVAVKDLYFGVRHPRYGVRIGHMKEPFSMEQLTSSKYITFIERGLPAAFDAGRNTGILVHGGLGDGNLEYGIGVFRETDAGGVGDRTGRYHVTGRIAGTIANRDGGRRLLHAGASFRFQNDSGSSQSLASRPEVHLSPRFIRSPVIPTESAFVVGFETAVVIGPLSAQAEWQVARFSSPATGDPSFSGGYAYLSYFLTGESRHYSGAVFGRTTPTHNFQDGGGGIGAIEVAARYSRLDLGAARVDERVQPASGATQLDNLTLALNWYWNPMTLIKFNAVRADVADVGDIWAFVWRAQIEF